MHEAIMTVLRSHLDTGLYAFGLADLSGLLTPKFGGYVSGISIVRKLDSGIIDGITEGPTPEYHAHYNEINNELNGMVARIADALSPLPVRAMPIRATVHDSGLDEEYLRTLRFDISHKMVATRAGLGWIGKTALLVSHAFGPRVRLASILLDCPLPGIAVPVEESLCGKCTLCVEGCPAGAANGTLWNAGIGRNEFFDPFACRDYCRRISKEKLDESISLCGRCVALCPRGTRGAR